MLQVRLESTLPQVTSTGSSVLVSTFVPIPQLHGVEETDPLVRSLSRSPYSTRTFFWLRLIWFLIRVSELVTRKIFFSSFLGTVQVPFTLLFLICRVRQRPRFSWFLFVPFTENNKDHETPSLTVCGIESGILVFRFKNLSYVFTLTGFNSFHLLVDKQGEVASFSFHLPHLLWWSAR